jgi:hypothetical protein
VLKLLLHGVSVAVPTGIDPDTRASLKDAIGTRHSSVPVEVEELLDRYRRSGLPTKTMGRSIDQDEDFFRAALAGGAAIR